jgi:dTDP-4-dehydrorhamnose reductase
VAEGVVVGGTGRLGSALRAAGTVRAPGRDALDLVRSSEAEMAAVVGGAPWVINAAALAGVDDCEREPARSDAVNAEGPGRLARACRAAGVPLLHISTDYVFGGGQAPYAEGAERCPLQAYGRSKARGEEAVLAAGAAVARVSWLFGPDGGPYQRWVLGQADGESVEVHVDQRSRPTPLPGLARWLLAAAERLADSPRILHPAGGPPATRAEWARAILRAHGRDLPVVPQRSPPFAPRPTDSVLDATATNAWAAAAGLPPIDDWRAVVAASGRAG